MGSKPTATAVLTNGLLMEAHFEGLGDEARVQKRLLSVVKTN
jgi:hypothetical protein